MIKTIEESTYFKYAAWAFILVLAFGTLALVHKLNQVTDVLAANNQIE